MMMVVAKLDNIKFTEMMVITKVSLQPQLTLKTLRIFTTLQT